MPEWGSKTSATEVIKEFGANAKGKTYVITGPSNRSIGASAAITLARAGASRIILLGRSQTKIQPVIDIIKGFDPTIETTWVYTDFLDNATVRTAAQEVTRRVASTGDGIHCLINSAGIMAPREFALSKDGVESQFATNHLGHFVLTNLLLPEITKARGVIVNVSSRGFEMGPVHIDDINFDNGKKYNGWLGYAQSKTANILFTVSLGEKLAGSGCSSFAVNPGLVMESGLQTSTGITPEFFQEGYELSMRANSGHPPTIQPVNLDQGASTIVWAALNPKLEGYSGSFLEFCGVTKDVKDYAMSQDNAAKLWALSEKLAG